MTDSTNDLMSKVQAGFVVEKVEDMDENYKKH